MKYKINTLPFILIFLSLIKHRKNNINTIEHL